MNWISFWGPGRRWLLAALAGGLLAAGPAAHAAEDIAVITRKVQPGDTLLITVDEADIGKVEKKIDANGRITFNYLGELVVKDKTTGEIEKMIRDGLDKDWIINPQVSCVVVQYAERVVSVSGYVYKPGPVRLPTDRKLSLIEAVSTAGDVNPRGNRKKVQLSRKGVVTTYNLNELARITDADKQVYVEPDDVITVPQTVF